MSRKSRFELWKSKINKQWHFRFVAGNGEVIAPSESYKRKIDCKAAITLLKGSGDSDVVEIK